MSDKEREPQFSFNPLMMQIPGTEVFVEAISDYSDSWFKEIMPLLPEKRREKAERMRFMEGKKIELLVGMLLHYALQEYGLSDWDVELSQYGKPFIRREDGREPVYFSISHTGPIAAVAISRENALGLDIEEVKDDRIGIAGRFFKPDENELLKRIAASPESGEKDADAAFIRLWTCKEAYGKLKGTGLNEGLSLSATPLIEAKNEAGRLIMEGERKISFSFGQYEKDGRSYLITLAREVI